MIWSGDAAPVSAVTRASFFMRSAVAPFTPASLSKACLTSRSQPPQVIPVTEKTNSLVAAIMSSFRIVPRRPAVVSLSCEL